MEYLKSVKSLDNSNNITTIQLTTNKRTFNIRLVYTELELLGDKKRLCYSFGIFDYCQLHNINTYKYKFGTSWELV